VKITWFMLHQMNLGKGGVGEFSLGGTLPSWIVPLPPDQADQVKPWPRTLCCVLVRDTSLSQCLSPPRCINGYQQSYAGG